MNELNYKMIGAALPPFCQKCGLVEEHQVHHGQDELWGWGETIAAHNFKGKAVGQDRVPQK